MIQADMPTPSPQNTQSQQTAADATTLDRRAEERLECPVEAIIAWNHNLAQLVRVHVIDISENGMHITSHLPILHGLTGIIINLLPERMEINKSFTIKWIEEPCKKDGPWHAGLQFVS